MRIGLAVTGLLAALALQTAPALARNSDPRPAEDPSTPTQCHSLQPGPDGSWIEIPCQELGAPAPRKPEGGTEAPARH